MNLDLLRRVKHAITLTIASNTAVDRSVQAWGHHLGRTDQSSVGEIRRFWWLLNTLKLVNSKALASTGDMVIVLALGLLSFSPILHRKFSDGTNDHFKL